MRFSERKKYKKSSTLIQTDGMNDELRISLWNVLFLSKWDIESEQTRYGGSQIAKDTEMFSAILWFNYFKKPVDTRPDNFLHLLQAIRKYFMECEWHDVYDFLEFTLDHYRDESLTELVNAILERELSGYRIINGIVSDITDSQEIEMLELVLSDNDFPAVKAHLRRALELLSNKESPDYRNSIKESISAVESLAKVLSENPKASLGDALKSIEKKGKLHPALKDGFSKLYGYTSDEGGIRHAMLDEPNLSAADAKFFLLACTNFINYLKSKA
jgi:hypothetical protein